jgi:hypothetical protein
LAGYHGRRGVLKWLIDERGVRVWGGSVCGVCIECKPPRPHNDTIHTTKSGKGYHSTCPSGHRISSETFIWMGVIRGRKLDVLATLPELDAVFAQPPSSIDTALWSQSSVMWNRMIGFGCHCGYLEAVQFLYARLQAARGGCTMSTVSATFPCDQLFLFCSFPPIPNPPFSSS